MGSLFSRPRDTSLPDGHLQENDISRRDDLLQVNKSVWQLYPAELEPEPELEVIFFHGLQPSSYKDAFWKTWRSRDGKKIWPKAWLGPSVRGSVRIRILSVSYDSSAKRSQTSVDVDPNRTTENLLWDLLSAGVGQKCRVVLVGHSLGGIMIKYLLLRLLEDSSLRKVRGRSEKIEKFVKNCKGAFYYSSPHGGSAIADWVIWGPTLTIWMWMCWAIATLGLAERLEVNYRIVSLLRRLSTKTALLNRDFDRAKHNIGDGQFRTRAIGETLPKTILWGKIRLFRVVQLASAMQTVDGEFYTAPGVDHSDVCKPKNEKTDPTFKYLLSFIDDLLQMNKVRGAELLEIDQSNVHSNEESSSVAPGKRVVHSNEESSSVAPGKRVVHSNEESSSVAPGKRVVHSNEESSSVAPGKRVVHSNEESSSGAPGKRLNESVWELWAPSNSTVPEVEVVLLHGVLEKPLNHEEAVWKPWLSNDETSTIWPKWLSKELPNPRILSISYVSIAESHNGWTDPNIVGDNLLQDMIDARVGQNCPVVLVGQNLGGYIIEKIIVQCFRKKRLLNRAVYSREVNRLENFLKNFRGMLFYSTPHLGLPFRGAFPIDNSDPLVNLQRYATRDFPSDRFRETQAFLHEATSYQIKIGNIVEGFQLFYASPHPIPQYVFQRTNLFTVCRPKDQSDRIFTLLVKFIWTVLPKRDERSQ